MTDTPLLNPAAIEEAKALMEEKFTTILGYFLEDSAEYVATILSAFESGDAQSMILPAHSLKSSAKQMGAERLSELSKNLESAAREATSGEKGLSALQPSIAVLKEVLAQTSAAYAPYRA